MDQRNGKIIVTAIERRNYDKIRKQISKGAQLDVLIEYSGVRGCSYLIIAALHGYIEAVKLLLESGVEVNHQNEEGCTALHYAIKFKHDCLTIIRILLGNGADVDVENKQGHTPLYLAVRKGQVDTVRLLLQDCPDLNSEVNKRAFAFAVTETFKKVNGDYSISTDYSRITRCLYDFGFSLPIERLEDIGMFRSAAVLELYRTCEDCLKHATYSDSDVFEAVLFDAGLNMALPVIELLFKYLPGACKKYSARMLEQAVYKRDCSVLSLLVKHGANVNCTYPGGDSPIIDAVRLGYYSKVEFLIEAGVDVTKLDHRGRPPIYYVFTYESTNETSNVLKLLLDAGSDLYWRGRKGRTLLHLASRNGDSACVEVLLDAGIDVDGTDCMQKTALYKAFSAPEEKRSLVIKTLLDHGADISLTSWEGFGPIHQAMCYDCLGLIQDHLSRMLVAGLIEDPDGWLARFITPEDRIKLEEELRLVKATKIGESRVFYHDLLRCQGDGLARCLEDENVLNLVESSDLETKFPLYGNLIRSKLIKGKKRMTFVKLAKRIIKSITEGYVEMPVVCVEKIVSYLDSGDLKYFIQKKKCQL